MSRVVISHAEMQGIQMLNPLKALPRAKSVRLPGGRTPLLPRRPSIDSKRTHAMFHRNTFWQPGEATREAAPSSP
jgi:hypothetical protein